jgi:hypothetical protein
MPFMSAVPAVLALRVAFATPLFAMPIAFASRAEGITRPPRALTLFPLPAGAPAERREEEEEGWEGGAAREGEPGEPPPSPGRSTQHLRALRKALGERRARRSTACV